MLTPGNRAAPIIDLLHREVSHEAIGCCAVPVVLSGLEERPVAGSDDLYGAAVPLAYAETLGDVDGLAVGVGMPGGASAGREVDAAR